MPLLAQACTACTATLQAAIMTPTAPTAADKPQLDHISPDLLALWSACAEHFFDCKQVMCSEVAVTYLPVVKLAVAVLDHAQACLTGSRSSSSSNSGGGGGEGSALRAWLSPRWECVYRAVMYLPFIVGKLDEYTSQDAVVPAGGDAAGQRQLTSALLESKEAKVLLALLLGLNARQLHKARHGKSPAASLDSTAAAADGNSTGSRQQRRQQQRRRQQQAQLLVPALHTQLLNQFGMREDLLAGSRIAELIGRQADVVAKACEVIYVLQRCHEHNSPPVRGAQQSITASEAVASSSSSSSGALSRDLSSTLLLTVVEVQVRAAHLHNSPVAD
jgi:hypothetical protein